MADFLLKVGVKFDAKDIDAKAISEAVAKSIANVKVKLSNADIDIGTVKSKIQDALSKTKIKIGSKNFSINVGALAARIQGAINKASKNHFIDIKINPAILEKQIREVIEKVGGTPIKLGPQAKDVEKLQQLVNKAKKAREELEKLSKAKGVGKLSNKLSQLAGRLDPKALGVNETISAIRILERQFISASETVKARIRPQVNKLAEDIKSGNVSASALTNTAKRLSKELRKAKLPSLREAGIRKGIESLKSANTIVDRYNKVVTSAEKSTANYNRILAQGSLNAEGFGAKIGQVTTRFAAYLVSIRALFAVQQAFNKSLQVIVRFDDAINDLRKVLGGVPADLQLVADNLLAIGQRTGRSIEEVNTSLNNFVRQGIGVEEALRRTEAALIAVNITELDAANATKFITSSLRIFGDQLKDAEEALDILSITADNAATTAGEVGKAFLRSASAAEATGITYRELNAIVAATIEQTQLSGEKIGTALKTVFTRIVANADALREQANALGANIKPGQDITGVLSELAAIFPTLNKEQRTQIGLIVAGRRQFTIFNGVINSLAKSEQLLEKQFGAAGTTARKNEAELNKLSTQARQLGLSVQELIVSLTGVGEVKGTGAIRDTLQQILEISNNVVSSITAMVQAIQKIEVFGVKLSSVFKGVGKLAFFATGAAIIKGIVTGLRTFLGIGQKVRSVLASIGAQQLSQIRLIARRNILLAEGANLERDRLAVLRRETDEIVKQSELESRNLKQRRIGGRDDVRAGVRRIAGFAALVASSQIAADLLSDWGDELELSKGSLSVFSADVAKAGSSAINLGVLFGILGGASLGAIGAITAFGFNVAKSSVALLLATRKIESFVRREAVQRVDFARAFADGGKFLAEVIKEGGRKEIQETVAFEKALRRLSGRLDAGTTDVSNTFDQISNELRRALRANEIQKALTDFTKQLRTKGAAIDLQIAVGGGGRGVSELARIIADLESSVERVAGKTKEQISLIQEVATARKVVSDLEKRSASDTLEILVGYGKITNETREFLKANREAERELRELDQRLGDLVPSSRKLVEGADKFIERLKAGQVEAKGTREANEALEETVQRITNLEKLNTARQTELKNLVAARAKIESKLIDFRKQGLELAKEDAKRVLDIVKSFEKVVETARIRSKQLILQTVEFQNQTSILKQQLDFQTQQINERRKGLSIEVQFNQEIARAREQQSVVAKKVQDEERKITSLLRDQLGLAEATGETALADRIREAVAEIETGFADRLNAELEKIKIQGEIELRNIAEQQLTNAERNFAEFRINEIQRVIEAESSATEQRIKLIKQIGAADLESEIRSVNTRLRSFFGDIGAIILKTRENAAKKEIDALVKQEQIIFQTRLTETEKLGRLQDLRNNILERKEQVSTANREAILNVLENASKRTATAEKTLVTERNKIPALNAKIIGTEKRLSEANSSLRDTTDKLFDSFRAVSEATADYRFALSKAAFDVNVATGRFGSFSSQLEGIKDVAGAAAGAVRNSEQKILEIRAQAAQEALSIFQREFDAIRDLGAQAATATFDELIDIQRGLSVAAQIAQGVAPESFRPEQIEEALRFQDIFPEIQRAISEFGLEKLGLDPRVLQGIEDQMLELARATADSARAQVISANQQVQTGFSQLAEAREQVNQAKQQVEIAKQQRDAQSKQIVAAQGGLQAARAGFSRIAVEARQRLSRLNNIQNILTASNNILAQVNAGIANLSGKLVATISRLSNITAGGAIGNFASGSLTNSEISGLINSARREKRAMPGNSNLMLANTSEVVLTGKQARQIGLKPMPKKFAQEGNAAVIDNATIGALAGAINGLLARINSPGFIQQNIDISLDQERTINLRGVDAVDSAIRRAFEDKVGKLTTKEEVNAVADLVSGVVDKLREQGLINVLGE